MTREIRIVHTCDTPSHTAASPHRLGRDCARLFTIASEPREVRNAYRRAERRAETLNERTDFCPDCGEADPVYAVETA